VSYHVPDNGEGGLTSMFPVPFSFDTAKPGAACPARLSEFADQYAVSRVLTATEN
jgi:hypothetical protein